MISPGDVIEEQVDCITSYLSYCWHYPKDMYWDLVMSKLKMGGRLILDVRTLPNRDIIAEISKDMNSEPVAHYFGMRL